MMENESEEPKQSLELTLSKQQVAVELDRMIKMLHWIHQYPHLFKRGELRDLIRLQVATENFYGNFVIRNNV